MSRKNMHRSSAYDSQRSVIPYPPGYTGQALTPELILFSQKLIDCPEEYRGFMMLLLKKFALDMGCGKTKLGRDYLKVLNTDAMVFWYQEDLPTIVFVSVLEEMDDGVLKRVLKIMPTTELPEFTARMELGPKPLPDREVQMSMGDMPTKPQVILH